MPNAPDSELNYLCAMLQYHVAIGKTPREMAVRALQAAIEDRYEEAPKRVLYLERFNTFEAMISDFRRHNQAANLGFKSEQIDALKGSIPFVNWDNPLETMFISWTLQELHQSLKAKLKVMRLVFGKEKVKILKDFRPYPVYLSLADGASEFEPNSLSWRVIDFGANRGKAPNQVDPTTAAGLGVLDAVTQHPDCTIMQNGQGNPYQGVPALRVKVPGKAGEPYAPYVQGFGDGSVCIGVERADRVNPNYAQPAILNRS